MRLLALVPPGTNARSTFSDLLRGAQLAGHIVFVEDLSPFIVAHQQAMQAAGGKADGKVSYMRPAYARHIEHTFRERRCDALIGLWVEPLMMLPFVGDAGSAHRASFIETLGIPMIHWWLDAPFWAYEGRLLPGLDRDLFTPPGHVHVINNEGTAEEMRRVLGFKSVFAQPYGVDEATFRPWPRVEHDYDLAINAGPGDAPPTKVMLEQLGRDEPDVEAIRRDQAWAARVAMLDVLRSSESGTGTDAERLVDAMIEQQLSDPDRPMMQKFDAAASGSGATEQLRALLTGSKASAGIWARLTAALRLIENWQRAFYAAFLSRRAKCMIIGAPSPSWFTPTSSGGWEVRGDRAGNVGYHELSLLYSRCRAGLNVMRYQDDVGLNPKVLEIAASGCCALQRWRRGIDDMFTSGNEIETFRTPSEAGAKLAGILADRSRRDAIAQAGRARVLRSHTWALKADEMLKKSLTSETQRAQR